MNFYYDPILGLQYTDLGVYLEIDICTIPSDFNVEEFIKMWEYYSQETGILIGNVKTWGEITDYNLN